MQKTKLKIYKIINANDTSKIGKCYDIIMLICIVLSLVPLAFKETDVVLWLFDKITLIAFIIDYILRWWTADIKRKDKSFKAYLAYPFTPMAIIDLLSILPSISIINNGFKALRLFRLARVLKIFKIFRLIRYSKNINILVDVLKASKNMLIIVTLFAVVYVIGTALLVFNVEPETFENFFDAMYWSTISLTTVGYGDIYLVSDIGRCVAMISSFIGVAIIALPASILTYELLAASQKRKEIKERKIQEKEKSLKTESKK